MSEVAKKCPLIEQLKRKIIIIFSAQMGSLSCFSDWRWQYEALVQARKPSLGHQGAGAIDNTTITITIFITINITMFITIFITIPTASMIVIVYFCLSLWITLCQCEELK